MNSFYEGQFEPVKLTDPAKPNRFRSNDLYVMKSDMRYVNAESGKFTRFVCEPDEDKDLWINLSFINAKHPEAFENANKRNDKGCKFVNEFLWRMINDN